MAVSGGCSAKDDERASVVLSLPGIPNPPDFDAAAGRLVRGSPDLEGPVFEVSAAKMLTDAALACGQREISWRGLSSDHGQELIMPDTPAVRGSLTCIARKVPFDFYVRREVASS